MFDQKFDAKLTAATPKAHTDKDGVTSRVTRLAFAFELTPELAKGINTYAVAVQEGISDGDGKAARIDLKRAACIIKCNDGQKGDKAKITLKPAAVVSLNLLAPGKEEVHPQATLLVDFNTKEAELLWFVNHLADSVGIYIAKEQTELPLKVVDGGGE